MSNATGDNGVPPTAIALPRPTAGDHLTLYTLADAAPYLHVNVQTLRRYCREEIIPAKYLTRIGRRGATARGTKIFMTGDQILGLLAYWRERSSVVERPPPPIRRRSKVAV